MRRREGGVLIRRLRRGCAVASVARAKPENRRNRKKGRGSSTKHRPHLQGPSSIFPRNDPVSQGPFSHRLTHVSPVHYRQFLAAHVRQLTRPRPTPFRTAPGHGSFRRTVVP